MIKTGDAHNLGEEICYDITQMSILAPLTFNKFVCDVFYFLNGVTEASYADHTTPYSASKTKVKKHFLK